MKSALFTSVNYLCFSPPLNLAFPANIQQIRSFASSTLQEKLLENQILNPWFLTGFVDGEGCFRLNIVKNKLNTEWEVRLSFSISLHIKDRSLLEKKKIIILIGTGKIFKHGRQSVQLVVSSKKDLQKIIKHFDKFPLITQKFTHYELWKKH